MILPRPRAIMWRATACPTKNTLSRLVRDQPRPGLVRELVQGCPVLDACVVDQDVDGSEVVFDGGDTRRDGLGVGHVEGRGLDRVAGSGQARPRLCEPPGIACVQHDRGPGGRERLRHGEPDPLARSGDQGAAAPEVEEFHAGVPSSPPSVVRCSTVLPLSPACQPLWRLAKKARAVGRTIHARRRDPCRQGCEGRGARGRPNRSGTGRGADRGGRNLRLGPPLFQPWAALAPCGCASP